ncbi:MAG: FliM/FliN family flagellar motor switch protein [Thermoleophilia bacterium]|nr:FliM/FliN family flagellar motor switch protein [Thermoleophilia bacterium]
MTPQPNTPWNEHVALAESVSQTIADMLGGATGSIVEVSKVAAFEPEDLLPGRPVPLRAIIVTFHRPLRDVLVFLTSLKEDQVRPLVETAAEATIAALDVPTSPDQHGPLGRFDVADAVELETIDVALEQCDALFLEATYGFEVPNGELRMVIGSGLLESAACFVNGVPDPYAVEAPAVSVGTTLELGDDIHAAGIEGLETDAAQDGRDGSSRYELGDDVIGGADTAAQLVTEGIGAAGSTSGIDAYDEMLAAQERAEAQAAAALGTGAAATAGAVAGGVADANVQAADAANAATERWTQLLSGVEVELSAELGRTDLTLGDITSLASDSVLTLDQLVHEPVGVYVNGTRYATARLVVVDGEYGIEILEVLEQDPGLSLLAA